MKTNKYLILGGIFSLVASLLHLGIIIGGPNWYRFFGAGEGMAQLAEKGSSFPTIVTLIIAVILGLWGFYALSGAGIIRKLPFIKLILITISAIYLLRGITGIPIVFMIDDPYLNELQGKTTFMIVSSLVSLTIGLCYLIGLRQGWSSLGSKPQEVT